LKPFLKWAGNKFQIIERIKTVLPAGSRLIEPFVGSGAVFLNTDYPKYLLADINPDLINLFKILKLEKAKFINYAKKYFAEKYNTETAFYQLREKFNRTQDIVLKSALFIYLNKHAFNGLCRYNASGLFNTPFGRYKKPYFPEKEMLFFAEKAQNAIFKCENFTEIMSGAEQGDVVYCDPPYVPLSTTANFTSYNKGGFNLDQQQALCQLAEKLAQKNIPVIISNHDTDFVQILYKNAEKIAFDVQRFISCNGAGRSKAPELLAVF
jgi:DNA adenine methylase